MEKKSINWNTIIGTVLMVAIVVGYSYFNRPDENSISADASAADTTQVVEVEEVTKPVLEENIASLDTNQVDSAQSKNALFGPFVDQSGDESERFTIENDILELKFSRRGAQLVAARLKDYQTWDSLPLYLVKESASHNLNLKADGKSYNTAELMFNARPLSQQAVEFTLQTADGAKLVYQYSLEETNYMLNWQVSSQGMSNMISPNTDLVWEMLALRHEKNLERETEKTNVEYYDSEDNDLDDLSIMGEDEETVSRVKWVAFKQQFFSTILLNKAGDFQQTRMFSQAREGDEELTKRFLTRVNVGGTGSEFNADLGLYLGPNKYDILKDYGYSFEKVIPMGWGVLGWINRGIVINVFNWLAGYGLNYGLIILIIAVLIKLIIFPLTFTSYKSMAKMRVLKPEIDALNEKYKDKDAMQKQQATMELYRKAGVNPLGGCIPVLLQMPILIALFNFFPSSIELRQQPFLWATDLSTYDSIYDLPFNIPFYGDHISLFTLLMTVSTLIYTYMNQQLTGQNQQFPQMKYIVYLMPLIFLGVFNNYAAGLSYYYFLSNMITFGQQYAIRSYIDDKKILAKMEEKKKSPNKENRLMRRMRELQEQQEKGRKK